MIIVKNFRSVIFHKYETYLVVLHCVPLPNQQNTPSFLPFATVVVEMLCFEKRVSFLLSTLGHAWRRVHALVRWVCVVQACMAGGACVAGETATAAGGTHPTERHSCFYWKY